MDYNFSDKIKSLRPSAAGNILKLGSMPGIISLAAGNPAPEAFPVEMITRFVIEELQRDPIAVLQYSVAQGYAPLREAVSNLLLSRYSISSDENEILILSGAQQGGDLVSKLFCNEGDAVAVETPSFMGCLDAFRMNGAKLVGIPMQDDGIDVAALERALGENSSIRMLYTIPNFQNPTGITMSLAKRKRLYELAVEYDIIILEDNPYGDLRFSGEHLPPIKSFDTTGHVVYMGSFSKILAPGVRVGYISAAPELVRRLGGLKLSSDVHTNILAQHICHRFLTETDMDAHLSALSEIYRKKCELMLGELDKSFSPKVSCTRPEGGLFIWCTLPDDIDSADFCRQATELGVLTVPGAAFSANSGERSSSFRLNFSTPTDENIVKGIKILGEMTNKL